MSSQKVSNWTAPAAPPGSPALTGLGSDPRALRSFTMTTTEKTSLAATNHLPATVGGATTGATYDPQGNLTAIYGNPGTSASQLTMTYDALGRVATLGDTAHSTSQTYTFDDEGLRIKSLDSATGLVKYNIYDEGRKLIAQYEVPSGGSLTWKKDLIYVGAKEVAEVDSAGKTWVQFEDHLGSPRLAWDGTATTSVDGVHLVAQKFAPFGESLYTVSATKFAKGFTNHEQTDASGLIYMQARFYAPMYGRFLSPDPARDQHFEQTQSWNIYSYVQNNPAMRGDPTGMYGGLGDFLNGVIDGVKAAPGALLNDVKAAGSAIAHPISSGLLLRSTSQVSMGPMLDPLIQNAQRGLAIGSAVKRHLQAGDARGAGKVLGTEAGKEGIITVGALALGGAAKGVSSALATAAPESTSLWRAVDSSELASINSSGSFSPSPSGSMGKYFSFTLEGAAAEGKGLSAATGDVYTIVETKAPTSILDPANSFTDRTASGPVLSTTVDNGNLGQLSTPIVHDSTPLPGKKNQ